MVDWALPANSATVRNSLCNFHKGRLAFPLRVCRTTQQQTRFFFSLRPSHTGALAMKQQKATPWTLNIKCQYYNDMRRNLYKCILQVPANIYGMRWNVYKCIIISSSCDMVSRIIWHLLWQQICSCHQVLTHSDQLDCMDWDLIQCEEALFSHTAPPPRQPPITCIYVQQSYIHHIATHVRLISQ